jgi:hypothetical protein
VRIPFPIIALLLFCLPAAWAQGEPYTFAEELPWLSEVGPAIRVLSALGYAQDNTFLDEENALVFSAEDELVYLYFNGDNRLLSVNLYLLTSAITADSPPVVQFSATEAAYGEIEQGLTEVYGAPSYSVVEFRDPYRYGDGLEIEAVREGLATLSSGWQNPSGEGGVFLSVDRDADIAVAWEAPGWSAYLEALE